MGLQVWSPPGTYNFRQIGDWTTFFECFYPLEENYKTVKFKFDKMIIFQDGLMKVTNIFFLSTNTNYS